jgi:hypothetical protein
VKWFGYEVQTAVCRGGRGERRRRARSGSPGRVGLDCAASVVEEVHRAASLAAIATGIRDALF